MLCCQSSQAFRFPLTLPGEWTEHELHGDSVTQMRLSYDDKRLVTTGRDGSLCIWKVGESRNGMEWNQIWQTLQLFHGCYVIKLNSMLLLYDS